MSVRLILQFVKSPSYALTAAEFWIRLLIETESPGRHGHVVGELLVLRKRTNALNIITAIEIELLSAESVEAPRYLEACDWWLHRAPFGVERLPVVLMARGCSELPVSAEGWHVTHLELTHAPACVCLRSFSTFFPSLETFVLAGTDRTDMTNVTLLSDLSVLQHLKLSRVNFGELRIFPADQLVSLDVTDSVNFDSVEFLRAATQLQRVDASGTVLHSVAPLRHCGNLRKLVVQKCLSLTDLSPLAGAPSLEEIDAYRSRVWALTGLSACPSLKKVNLTMCESLEDLSPLAGADALEEIHASGSRVERLAGLDTCLSLKAVNFSWCTALGDLSALAGAPCLEIIDASMSAVSTLGELSRCTRLRKVIFTGCAGLVDLSSLSGAPALEVIHAPGSAVSTLTGLNACERLTKVNLNMCTSLTDLSPLAGAVRLEEVSVAGSGVTNVRGLRKCPRLVTLDLRGAPAETLYGRVFHTAPSCAAF